MKQQIHINDQGELPQFDLPPAAVFQLQSIAMADDDMVKREGAAEKYRYIARHILELFQKREPGNEAKKDEVTLKPKWIESLELKVRLSKSAGLKQVSLDYDEIDRLLKIANPD